MKKITAIIMALVLIFTACFSALGENGASSAPPDKPSGEPPEGMGNPPEGMGMPPEGMPPEGMGNPPGGMGTPPGGGSSGFEYSAATEISGAAEESGKTYTSQTGGESALIVNTDADVSLSDITVTKTGDSDGGDNCSFYGLNAALLVMGGSNTVITGATVVSEANGANGVFVYGGNGGRNGASGDGTAVYISDSTVVTYGDSSGGIMTTGGGVTYASNLNVETSGRSSAAIRTDRGGGTVSVDGGSYITSGLGSPAIYSTADITVSNAFLTSNLSEGVCIEGKNSITLINCELSANNTARNGNATFLDTVMIYQSMSGDADSGSSYFTMSGGSLKSLSGHMFHVTNTHAVISLSSVELINADEENILLSVCDDGWSGASNIAELNADAQTLKGNVLVGSNSYFSLALANGSSFEGTFSGNITNNKGETVSAETGSVSVSLDETSTWTLTADTYISAFEGDIQNVISNGFTLYVNGIALN